MQHITTENLESFRPSYPEYHRRRIATAENVGVESIEDLKNFRAEVERWNRESAIGFSKAETNIISLILSEDEGNQRFDMNDFIDPDRGGNTAEHPIFIGHKIDAVRDAAGYGAHEFADNARSLAAAKLSQVLHSRAALHDTGELIDISYTEQKQTGASSKEPPEEALVGPFKVMLAAYAISVGDPNLYIRKMHEARERIREKKRALYQEAIAGRITGDAFVAGVGHEIKAIVDDVTAKLADDKGELTSHLRPNYREAMESLTTLFHESQDLSGFQGAMFNLMDKIEGDAHFRHFIGRPPEPHAPDASLMTRMFNGGRAVNFHLASSDQVISSITYAQKTIPAALAEADKLAPGAERDVAVAYARAASALLLRNHIRMLQKSAPWVDTTRADTVSAKRTNDPAEQEQQFAQRLEAQRALRDVGKLMRKEIGREPVTRIEGVIDTQTLIAVLEKAATAIDLGKYKPTKADLPIGLGELPPQLQVTHEDIVDSTKKHPMEKQRAYPAQAGAVRL